MAERQYVTVKELMEKLSKVDPDVPVFVAQEQGEGGPVVLDFWRMPDQPISVNQWDEWEEDSPTVAVLQFVYWDDWEEEEG